MQPSCYSCYWIDDDTVHCWHRNRQAYLEDGEDDQVFPLANISTDACCRLWQWKRFRLINLTIGDLLTCKKH